MKKVARIIGEATKRRKPKRKITEKDGKFYTPRGVEATRNAHTMTEANYFAMILSALRGTTRFWKPATQKLESCKRPSQSSNKRLKFEYLCESCLTWCPRKSIQIDHIIPCGGINGYDKIVPWLKRAHVEEGFQILCTTCHKKKTLEERNEKID